jgi:HEAT repeat protein
VQRLVCGAASLLISVLSAGPVLAQTARGEPEPTPPPLPAESPPGLPDEKADMLKEMRDTVLDASQSKDSRRTAARFLVRFQSEAAKTFVAELLGMQDDAQTQALICNALTDFVKETATALDPLFVEPLLALFSAKEADLRAQAAEALALSSEQEVVDKLCDLAADQQALLPIRLAAIDALAAHIDRPHVVGRLIGLLNGNSQEIDARVVKVLETATGEPFGADHQRWRNWWTEKSSDWSAYRLAYYREQTRRLRRAFAEFRNVAESQQTLLTDRLVDMQQSYFRLLSPDLREEKLAQWLREPLSAVRRAALGIITTRMGDEGYRPTGKVMAALLELLDDPSAQLRQEVLRIVQNLHEPATMDALLTRLPLEKDVTTRRAMLRALGELGAVESIPVLVAEIDSDQADISCVAEAAIALGLLAGKVTETGQLAAATEPLERRYLAVPNGNDALRPALLRAMAGVGAPAFGKYFLDALDSNDPEMLRPAIRGLIAIREVSKLPRLRDLTSHEDLAVRLAAIQAVGDLGRDDIDAECLLARMTDHDEPAREAAWAGFLNLMKALPLAQQLEWSDRLRDLPDAQIRFLLVLENEVTARNTQPADLEAVQRRLGAALASQGQYAEAVSQLQSLYASLSRRNDPGAFDVGLLLLEAMLKGRLDGDALALIEELASAAPEESAKQRIVERVSAYFDAPGVVTDLDRMEGLLAQLRQKPMPELGRPWSELLSRVEERLQPQEEARESEAGTTTPADEQ